MKPFRIFCKNRKASCFLVPNLVGLIDRNFYMIEMHRNVFGFLFVESGSTDSYRVKSPSLGACRLRESLAKGISRCQEAGLL